jgi:DNA-binding PadR family transcriptional regulator
LGSKRFFRHGELPLLILWLLKKKPMHGYQILGELTILFGDSYEPSTGAVYPAITALKEQRLIASGRGQPKIYRLTELGEKILGERQEQLAELEMRTGCPILENGSIDSALDRFAAKVRSVAGELEVGTIEEALDRLGKELIDVAAKRRGSDDSKGS